MVFKGAGRDIHQPKKTGRPLIDNLNWLDFRVLSFLRWLDSIVLFKGRKVVTPRERVRSRAERKIVDFFLKHRIAYQYEKPLEINGILLHPDFYLPQHDVYVEFWGLADSDRKYQEVMQAKKRLYQKEGKKLISLYPRQLKNLEREFPKLFELAVGKEFSD